MSGSRMRVTAIRWSIHLSASPRSRLVVVCRAVFKGSSQKSGSAVSAGGCFEAKVGKDVPRVERTARRNKTSTEWRARESKLGSNDNMLPVASVPASLSSNHSSKRDSPRAFRAFPNHLHPKVASSRFNRTSSNPLISCSLNTAFFPCAALVEGMSSPSATSSPTSNPKSSLGTSEADSYRCEGSSVLGSLSVREEARTFGREEDLERKERKRLVGRLSRGEVDELAVVEGSSLDLTVKLDVG